MGHRTDVVNIIIAPLAALQHPTTSPSSSHTYTSTPPSSSSCNNIVEASIHPFLLSETPDVLSFVGHSPLVLCCCLIVIIATPHVVRSSRYVNAHHRSKMMTQTLFHLVSTLITAAVAQLDQTIYHIYQPESEVACGAATVAVQGQVIDESFLLQRAPSGSCSARTLCLLSPSSDGCIQLTDGLDNTASVSVSYTQGGQLLECDTSNSDIGEELCVTSPLPCAASSAYPPCTVTLLTGQDLVDDPTVLSSDVAASDVNVQNTGYTIYYSDEVCTKLAALRGTVLETNNTFLGVDVTVPCDESMACLLNPSGPACASLAKQQDGGETSGFLRYRNDTLLYCDASSGACNATNSRACARSTAFPNCYE
jgi:hypothetical protein